MSETETLFVVILIHYSDTLNDSFLYFLKKIVTMYAFGFLFTKIQRGYYQLILFIEVKSNKIIWTQKWVKCDFGLMNQSMKPLIIIPVHLNEVCNIFICIFFTGLKKSTFYDLDLKAFLRNVYLTFCIFLFLYYFPVLVLLCWICMFITQTFYSITFWTIVNVNIDRNKNTSLGS